MANFDILIRRGTVVDGTRGERRIADVAISGGKIARIGDLGDVSAETVIDAEGLIVAPGFIDTHTHYDAQIFWDPYCTATSWHGVTTLQMTNCGFGLAPLPNELHERGMQMMTRTEQIALDTMRAGVPYDWQTYPEFLDSLRRTPKGVNVASYFPLNPALFWVMGAEEVKKRLPNDDEVRQLQAMLGEAIDAGALGMSWTSMGGHNNHTDFDGSQLPTEYLPQETVAAMASVLRDRGRGLIQILTRYGDFGKDKAVAEAVATAAQRPVLYNAIVAAVDFGEGGASAQMKWLDECGAAGIPVYGQGGINRNWLEYTMEDFNLFDIVPVWAEAAVGDAENRKKNFSDPAIRAEMKKPENFDDIDWLLAGLGPQKAIVVNVRDNAELKKYEGRVVDEIAAEEGRHPVDVFLDIACATDLTAEFRTLFPTSWNHEEAGAIARHPRVALGVSDGGAHGHMFNGTAWPTETLAWLVRDTGQMELEEAHYKLSAFPAELAGYRDRGTLEEGKAADVVVYDLENLAATPEFAYETLYDQPAGEFRKVQRAEGYRWIIVNGQITFIDGKATGNHSGQVLSSEPV
ncbi:MAG: amidohydrolase family protein [Nocardia sp.]|nr:amidohydrolase family protein [Nocardia sp.]